MTNNTLSTTRLNVCGGRRLVLARYALDCSTKGGTTLRLNAIGYANPKQAERKRDEMLAAGFRCYVYRRGVASYVAFEE